MKVICVGIGKTGTTTLARALRSFGYKVYDFDDQSLHYLSDWEDAFFRDKEPDFKRMFENIDAVTDFPSNFFFEEIMEAFPEAKVILSIRDEEPWAKSLSNQLTVFMTMTLYRLSFLSPTFRRFKPVFLAYLNAMIGSADPRASYVFRKRLRQHNNYVKTTVPPNRLLIFTVKQGWKPLCDFLALPVPDEPFPHENVRGEIAFTFQTGTDFGRLLVREVKQTLAIIVVVVAIIPCLLFYFTI